MKYPSVSVIMPTLNSERTLENCLKSIRSQNYPQEKIEILIIDGGSTDSTEDTSKKYKCRFINGGYKNNQEPRKGVGLHAAKNELVAYLDSDNILPGKSFFKQSVKPFIENDDLAGAETWRYGHKKDFAVFNRYCALLGANDPVAFYLGKADKISWVYDEWQTKKKVKNKNGYILINFDTEDLPTLGGNGFFASRKLMLTTECDPKDYFHIDVVMDLVRMGHTKFAMVKNSLYHDTAASLSTLAGRRIEYFKTHNPAHSNRRYLVFNPKSRRDRLNLLLYVIYTVTLIQPILFSIRGYLKKKDSAWFLHPLVCWTFLYAYAVATISLFFSKQRA
jgi:glycosyltransferase involved in cell wall biosynthesis